MNRPAELGRRVSCNFHEVLIAIGRLSESAFSVFLSILILLIGLTTTASPVVAKPDRVIILRHGEKAEKDEFKLCETGIRRSRMLAKTYLGERIDGTLLDAKPVAIMAVTLHTIETAAPTAKAWGLPISAWVGHLPYAEEDKDLATELAAEDVLKSSTGGTVIMVWDHSRIASRKHKSTLRNLLGLDNTPDVPKEWPDDIYDYFWIVEYPRGGNATRFELIKQDRPEFADLPANNWKQRQEEPSGCDKSPSAGPRPEESR